MSDAEGSTVPGEPARDGPSAAATPFRQPVEPVEPVELAPDGPATRRLSVPAAAFVRLDATSAVREEAVSRGRALVARGGLPAEVLAWLVERLATRP